MNAIRFQLCARCRSCLPRVFCEKFMNHSEEFVRLMTDFQGRLYGFILSLVCDVNEANDLLQETNLVLWRQSDDFQMGSDFKAWSFRVAHFQVMAMRQRTTRNRLVFDGQLLESISSGARVNDELYQHRRDRLEKCLKRLSTPQRDVVCRFYEQNESLATIASSLGCTANAVGQMLFRIRKGLILCVSVNPQAGLS